MADDAAASDASPSESPEFAWTPPSGWIGSGSPGLADEIERTWAQMRDPPLEDVVSAEEKAKLAGGFCVGERVVSLARQLDHLAA